MQSETERSDAGHIDEHPYSVAFRSGDLVAVSGRLGVDASGHLVPGGFDAECARAFANLDAALPYGAVVEVEALARVRDAPATGGSAADGH